MPASEFQRRARQRANYRAAAGATGDTLQRMRERRGIPLPENLHPIHARRLDVIQPVHYAPDAAHPLFDARALSTSTSASGSVVKIERLLLSTTLSALIDFRPLV